jgi:hypothetical protein
VVETAARTVRSRTSSARRQRAKLPLESCQRRVVRSAFGVDRGARAWSPGGAAIRLSAMSSNVSCANEFGEPNGEPMPEDAGPRQAAASHGFRS